MGVYDPTKFFGKYRGKVSNNKDPEGRLRIRIRVPELLGDFETDWALPCIPFGGMAQAGTVNIPAIGANVWVEFEGGDIRYPIYVGYYFVRGQVPTEAQSEYPKTIVYKTKSGHTVTIKDGSSPSILIEGVGTITVTAPRIDIDSDDIRLGGGGPAVARVGDAVSTPHGPGSIIGGSSKVQSG